MFLVKLTHFICIIPVLNPYPSGPQSIQETHFPSFEIYLLNTSSSTNPTEPDGGFAPTYRLRVGATSVVCTRR